MGTKHILFLAIGLSLNMCTMAQATDQSETIDINSRLKSLRLNTLKADSEKQITATNQLFKSELIKAIEKNEPLNCDSIPNFGCIRSSDKQFKLYTWNILKEYSQYEYFAVLKFKKGKIIEFNDRSNKMSMPEFKINSPDQWFGALYYDIIPIKNKKKEKYYVLLGWDGNSDNSLKKVIDVLYFDAQLSTWQLGKKIFGPPFRDQTRFFLEYSTEVNASLKYHKKENRIIFDHLVPLNPELEGVFEFYVPDLSYDGFEFRDDYWYFIQNVDVRGKQTMKNYTTPKTNLRLH